MAKIPRVPIENQITTLSVVKITIKFSLCTYARNITRILLLVLVSRGRGRFASSVINNEFHKFVLELNNILFTIHTLKVYTEKVF